MENLAIEKIDYKKFKLPIAHILVNKIDDAKLITNYLEEFNYKSSNIILPLNYYNKELNKKILSSKDNKTFFSLLMTIKEYKKIQRSHSINNLKKYFDLIFLDLKTNSKEEYNSIREIITDKRIDVFFNAENNTLRNSLRYNNGGIDYICARILQSNNQLYLFDFSLLISQNHEKIRKMIQNIRLIRKYKIAFIFSNLLSHLEELRNYHDIVSLSTLFHINKGEIKKSQEELLIKIIKNKLKNLGQYDENNIYYKIRPLEFFDRTIWWK